MPAGLLLVTEAFFQPSTVDDAVRTWAAHAARHEAGSSALFRGTGDASVLELTALSVHDPHGDERGYWAALRESLAPAMVADVRRQILEFVEAPKSTDALLPQTPYVQLRHVEVRPPVYDRYRHWRERTIFSVVRQAPEVDMFLAYHSLISTEPGVLFVSGFTCEPAKYLAVFESPEYQEIVRQAGNEYITGGERGLYTKVYARLAG
jgi:hypothetical protein